MKTLQQLCAVCVLTLTLALHTFAGQITTIIPPPPPPETADGQISTGAAGGEMTTTVAGQIETMNSEAIDPVTEIVLSLLRSVLPLF